MALEQFPLLFVGGATGAFCVQAIEVVEQHGKLPEAKFLANMKSKLYWSIHIVIILVSGLVVWGLHERLSLNGVSDTFLAGGAARAILRGLIAVRVHHGAPVQGEVASVKLRDVFC